MPRPLRPPSRGIPTHPRPIAIGHPAGRVWDHDRRSLMHRSSPPDVSERLAVRGTGGLGTAWFERI